ncbi:hypothetical protein A6U86_32025 [Rhizobium sp. AC27/96]|uniref:hypothetical protein n=1 Tax=Rhizobium sp. AC27/96 TaxID=1841653 RepID=UPI00082807EC|nr:hypothetical protein [Rhizobium sp. AC27/96]OCJ02414.1 hypothetical protein A6U86_32025 [Rhizobium sp. AC27/96]
MRRQSAWFRVKAYGYGAGLPCSWQGWAALTAYALVLGAVFAMGETWRDGHPASYVLAIFISTALLFLVSWWKSDAPWRWRWGGDKGNGM